MSDDPIVDDLVAYARNQIEGPTRVSPPQPEPYNSCRGCKHFSKQMAHSGGQRGEPTYFKSCIHPDVEGPGGRVGVRRLSSGFHGSRGSSRDGTPDWCPYLQNDPVDLSDAVTDNSPD